MVADTSYSPNQLAAEFAVSPPLSFMKPGCVKMTSWLLSSHQSSRHLDAISRRGTLPIAYAELRVIVGVAVSVRKLDVQSVAHEYRCTAVHT
jgi:hypothetical protein